MFADDTNLFLSDDNISELFQQIKKRTKKYLDLVQRTALFFFKLAWTSIKEKLLPSSYLKKLKCNVISLYAASNETTSTK